MSQPIASIIKFLLLWGVPVAAGTLAVSLYLEYRISRGHRWGWPSSWSGRLAKVFLFLVNVAAVSWLVMMLGPQRNLANGAQRFRGLMDRQSPDLVFRLVESDKELRLHQLRGKVVLLNLWATWCPPCVQELPELDRLQQTYGKQGLIVVALSQEQRKDLLRFTARNPSAVMNGYAKDIGWLDIGNARPVSLVLDRKGVLRNFICGRSDFEGFETMVQPYL